MPVELYVVHAWSQSSPPAFAVHADDQDSGAYNARSHLPSCIYTMMCARYSLSNWPGSELDACRHLDSFHCLLLLLVNSNYLIDQGRISCNLILHYSITR